jgi:hypothetical protein
MASGSASLAMGQRAAQHTGVETDEDRQAVAKNVRRVWHDTDALGHAIAKEVEWLDMRDPTGNLPVIRRRGPCPDFSKANPKPKDGRAKRARSLDFLCA